MTSEGIGTLGRYNTEGCFVRIRYGSRDKMAFSHDVEYWSSGSSNSAIVLRASPW